MRNLFSPEIDRCRVRTPDIVAQHGSYGDEKNGAFLLPSPVDSKMLRIIASSDDGWEHVSVSRMNRCPNWTEMSFVKRAFFLPDEVVMQLHVAEREHINHHPYCLHLWRPLNPETPIPLPPGEMVA